VQRFLYRAAGKFLGQFEAKVRYGMIDWSRTDAYFDENPYFPVVAREPQGKATRGIVEPGRHYEEVARPADSEAPGVAPSQTGAAIVSRA